MQRYHDGRLHPSETPGRQNREHQTPDPPPTRVGRRLSAAASGWAAAAAMAAGAAATAVAAVPGRTELLVSVGAVDRGVML